MEKEKINYDERIEELQKAKAEKEAEFEKEENLNKDRRETKEFYRDLIDDLRAGVRPPNEVIDFEDVPLPPPDEIARMSEREHQVLEEKIQLAEELRETRQQMERKELESAVADDIIKERSSALDKKIREMTPAELWEFEKRTRDL